MLPGFLRRSIAGLAVSAFLLGPGTLAHAKNGFYLGLEFPYSSLEGDFDGNSALVGNQDIIVLPLVKDAFGVGFLLGYDLSETIGIELHASQTIHNVEWLGEHGDAEHTIIKTGFKFSALPDQKFRPNLFLGISFDQLVIQDGSISSSNEVGDATLDGLGLDLGLGVDYYFTPRFSTGASMVFHYIEYTDGKGVRGSGTIDPGVKGSSLGAVFNGIFYF